MRAERELLARPAIASFDKSETAVHLSSKGCDAKALRLRV
jgi:hypothetical protein